MLRQRAAGGPWEHINSIEDDGSLSRGRKHIESRDCLEALFADLQDVYGSFSLHRIVRTGPNAAGARFLEKEGMRASLPAEAPVVPDREGLLEMTIHHRVSIVSLNVDGLNEY